MALIFLPDGADIRGSIGGTVYSRNRSGNYKRGRTVPVNPNTDAQVEVRNAMRSLTIAWQTLLTEAQRQGWSQYADNVPWVNKLGQTVKLTGLNMYCRSNVPRIQNGLAVIDDAPTVFDLAPAELALVVTASEAAQTLSVAFDDTQPWASEDGAFQSFLMGLPQNDSITFFGGPFASAGVILGDNGTPPTSPQILSSLPFSFAAGQRLWVRSRIGLADGRLSEFAQVNFLAVA